MRSYEELDRPASKWTPRSLMDVFAKRGCAVVRSVVPLEQIEQARQLFAAVYKTVSGLHVFDSDLRAFSNNRFSGFELAEQPLLQDFLALVFSNQNWSRMDVTGRRIRGVSDNIEFQKPLPLHLDAQYHGPRFTVNFWTPLQDCGQDVPSLQLVPVDYRTTRAYVGFTAEPQRADSWYRGHFAPNTLDIASVTARFGNDCFFRPVMKAGDIVVSSNWIIHGTYQTPQMTRGRTSAEIRYVGEKFDIEAC